MIRASEYLKENGKIVMNSTFDSIEVMNLNKSDTRDFVDGHHDGSKVYVNSGVPTPRPIFTLTADKKTIKANGQEHITINGLPEGICQAMIWGAVYDAWEQEGDIQLTVNMPGSYTLRISQWPYQDSEVTFDAT